MIETLHFVSWKINNLFNSHFSVDHHNFISNVRKKNKNVTLCQVRFDILFSHAYEDKKKKKKK